jgi:NO-binding membrane sensor protein with MHYT domain
MTDQDITTKYPIGSMPEISFMGYIIFCSFVVSLIGAITTVELLHRRASRTGWRSWVQLAGCSVSFGLVAIWCMHFVGNRAIVLGDGEGEIQLHYSSTFTVISAIIPVVVLFVGLLTADRFHKRGAHISTRIGSLVLCAFCAGAAITEMHYLGNNGTTNYHLVHKWSHVIGAASIAVGASLLSFGLFFHWSGLWMNNFLRRMVVACFLALAVSGMHWTAAAGTKYEIRGYYSGSGKGRNINLITAICLVSRQY